MAAGSARERRVWLLRDAVPRMPWRLQAGWLLTCGKPAAAVLRLLSGGLRCLRLQASGVLGLLVFPQRGRPMPWLHPGGDAAAALRPQNLSASSVPHEAGAWLWEALGDGGGSAGAQLSFKYDEVG